MCNTRRVCIRTGVSQRPTLLTFRLLINNLVQNRQSYTRRRRCSVTCSPWVSLNDLPFVTPRAPASSMANPPGHAMNLRAAVVQSHAGQRQNGQQAERVGVAASLPSSSRTIPVMCRPDNYRRSPTAKIIQSEDCTRQDSPTSPMRVTDRWLLPSRVQCSANKAEPEPKSGLHHSRSNFLRAIPVCPRILETRIRRGRHWPELQPSKYAEPFTRASDIGRYRDTETSFRPGPRPNCLRICMH